MKIRRLEPARHTMPNMTAMVDLVMCILLFFLMAAQFRTGTWLPGNFDARGVAPGKPVHYCLDFDYIVLLRNLDGKTMAEIADGGRQKVFAVSAHSPELRAELTKVRSRWAGRFKVVLRTSSDVCYREMAQALSAIRDAGFDDIGFAVCDGTTVERRPDGSAVFVRPRPGGA